VYDLDVVLVSNKSKTSQASAGRFDTTYLDGDLRVSRGSFGELRVFQRSSDSDSTNDDYYTADDE
jgi:PAP_fibrillin